MVFQHVFARMFSMESWIAGAVFVLVAAAVIFAVVRGRARRKPAPHWKINPLEIGYTVVLAGVAAFLVVASTTANGREHTAAGDPVRRVEVTAFQWCWRFHYTGTPVTVNGQCAGGNYPTLVLPTDRTVAITLRSGDVIHSFWVPALRFKMDVFPHHTNTFRVKLDKQGTWTGRCAEFCGVDHSTMDFHLRTVPPEAFDRWIAAGGPPGGAS